MRSILVHADRGPAMESRLETALAIARAFGGRITVLIDTPVTRYVAMDPMGGSYLASDALNDALDVDDRQADQIQARLSGQSVPFEVLRSEAEPVTSLAEAARLADLTVLSRSSAVAGDLALNSRTPLLVLPDQTPLAFPIARACIAWDGGDQAALALRLAVPLLASCGAVQVLTVEGGAEDLQAGAAARYLALHGIAAQLVELPRQGSVEETLSNAVTAACADLLVMGAYGHSRVREFLFGGVTRHFLENSQTPALFLAH